MVLGLSLSTPRFSADGSSDEKQPPATLPSFDDLLRSLGRQDENLRHHLHRGLHQAHHHAHPQPCPAFDAHHPHPGHHGPIRRPPSTPPTPSTGTCKHDAEHSLVHHVQHLPGKATRGRPRANTAPSVSNTHLASPFCCHRSQLLPYSAEHCADRVRALKDGDGEWNWWSFDAVAPSILPYHARPHLHSRTSISPILSYSSCSPLHHPHHNTQSCFSPTPVHHYSSTSPTHSPVAIPTHHRTPSYGSHSSPLSTSVPLTPRSIFSVCDDVEMRSAIRELRTPTPTGSASEGKKAKGGVPTGAGGVRIPTLPKMC